MALIPQAYAVNIQDIWDLAKPGKGFSSLGDFVSFVVPKFMLLAGIIFFFMIVFAGIGMISSAGKGDAHSAEQAKAFLTYGIIGLLLIFCSFWILQVINFVTGGSLSGPQGIL